LTLDLGSTSLLDMRASTRAMDRASTDGSTTHLAPPSDGDAPRTPMGAPAALAWPRRAAGACFVAATLGLAACAAPSRVPVWSEATTDHLVVRTPEAIEDTARIARDMETMLAELAAARPDILGPLPDARGRTQRLVIVALGVRQYVALFGGGSIGMFRPAPPLDIDGQPMLFLRVDPGTPLRVVARHELTHYLLSQRYGALNRWMNEGLAQFFSTVRYENGALIVGEPIPEREIALEADHEVNTKYHEHIALTAIPPPSAILRGARGYRLQAEYLGAYTMVHMFLHGPDYLRGAFGEYLRQTTTGASHGAALASAFAAIPPAQIDADFAVYARSDTRIVRRVRGYAPGVPAVLRARVVAPVDVVNTLAEIAIPVPTPFSVTPLLDEIIAEGTANSETLAWRAIVDDEGGHPDVARARIQAARRLDPRDPRPLMAAVHLAARAPNARTSAGRAAVTAAIRDLEPLATTPFQLGIVAAAELGDGRAAEALATSRAAFGQDHACYVCAVAFARALEASGDRAQALEVEERAVNLAPPGLRAAEQLKLERLRGGDLSTPSMFTPD
jgi:hypothetical protein